jgi:hypothetical protein
LQHVTRRADRPNAGNKGRKSVRKNSAMHRPEPRDISHFHEVIAPRVVDTGIWWHETVVSNHELESKAAELAGESADQHVALQGGKHDAS